MTLLNANTLEDMVLYMLITVVILVAYMAMSLVIRSRRIIREHGVVDQPRKINYGNDLFVMLGVAALVIFLMKTGIENNVGMLNQLLFAIFPYLALAIFLIGSIYRYLNRGFQVSSLSSEFLERKRLFWGSQPFHWGLLVLFFGHLIAFLFPRAVLAWNGEPVRLIILEVTAFVFGLSALIGLILLIRRRLSSDRVQIVTNKMDMLVYTTLIVQLVSGLGVAYFSRWGSSWFAGVLTPYLRSVFAFNPDISAVSTMPWMTQVHIFSAFFIIAIIPFTRFMHFLVAPIDYLWRRYQLVIWNWSRKSIRNSTTYHYGKRSQNN